MADDPAPPPQRTPTTPPHGPRATDVDPVTLEIFRHLFTALTEEMGAALRRAAFSPNIKERRDYSCALFDPRGVAVAMGDHMPVHLGAMPMSVTAALDEMGTLEPGDVAFLNDPFRGGTHLPDITSIQAVYLGEEEGNAASRRLLGFVAARAHHSDVGGSSPGSMPLAREIYEEGLRIPPIRLVRGGVRNEEAWRLLLANVRTPVERAGDLDAQLAALHAGRTRLLELVERRGPALVGAAMTGLIAYADRMVDAGIDAIPDGRYAGEDRMEDDGFGSGPIPIRAVVEVKDRRLRIDFSGTARQVPGGVNAVAAITSSAARYVVRCVVEDLLGETLPAGGGSMSAVELVLPEGSLVNATLPASVAAGNVETSQRITDVLFRAFGEALPERIPALSQGTMNNTTMGGVDPRSGEAFAYYETVGGGMGAGPDGPGLSGVHVHMSNSLNTPVEALEHAYPFRVVRYGLRRGTGGVGLHDGGEGLQRDIRLLTDARVTLLSERRESGPDGARGGGPGSAGENVLIRDGVEEKLPGKVTFDARAGDVVSVRSPGGGGWGKASSALALVSALLVGACGPDAPDAPDVRDPAADAAHAAPSNPAATVPALEDALLADPAFIPFSITAEGAIEVELEGSLALAPGNRARLEASGTFAGTPQELLLVSDGERMVLTVGDSTVEGETPPELNESLAVGFTRMGVLHNLARLTGAAGPDHAGGGVREWVVLEGHRPGEDGGVAFDIVVDGSAAGSATLFVDEGRPVERRQVVRFPQGEMRVVEAYGEVAMGPGTGIADAAFRREEG